MNKLLICSEYCSKYLKQFQEQNLLGESYFWRQIPPESLTSLESHAIITGYKGGQDQVDTPKFKQFISRFLREKLVMYQFNLKGDMGRHHLSISGAYTECGISTSTINRSAGKTFPPKIKLSEGRIGFRLYQVEEWLNGKRGGWN
jgi:predicted DNA-binding transcriptional regulator AlpA